MKTLQTLPLVFLVSLTLFGCGAPKADPTATVALARCVYVNAFSDNLECKEYLGSDWTPEAIGADCASPVPGSDPGVVEMDLACDRAQILGECFIDAGTVESATIVFPGREGDSCNGLRTGCNFAGGDYVPASACGGEDPDNGVPAGQTFRPFEQVCMDPLPGEPVGAGPSGQVCTWEAISASTEEGRKYTDYASCDQVVQQRPYWAAESRTNTPQDDPRYSDDQWKSEFEWVTKQVESSACVCCHSAEAAPDAGPSGWYIEAEGIWIDGVDNDGLAMLAGWIDSTAFGAFDPEDNNNFDRSLTGLGTTDPLRMTSFLEGELGRRGLSPDDFAASEAFGGPLADQLTYVPEACPDGIGISRGDIVSWAGGGARYVYVLETWSDNPGVPPNLDLPFGTHWRLDVHPDADPISSGLRYGATPEGSVQAWPPQGGADMLISGRDYYLYVLRDVYQPITRCIFTAQ